MISDLYTSGILCRVEASHASKCAIEWREMQAGFASQSPFNFLSLCVSPTPLPVGIVHRKRTCAFSFSAYVFPVLCLYFIPANPRKQE
jgi:hypothetical protein